MSVRYCDFSGGNDSNDATSFANRVKTITSGLIASRIAPGDELRIMKSPAPLRVQDSSGSNLNATFTNKLQTVTLSAAATKTIFLTGTWIASANVTYSSSATRKEGSDAAQLAIASAFITGLVAYFPLGSAQDFSGYTKITFWLRTSTVVAASTFRIDLCSDAAGVTAVNSFTLTDAMPSNLFVPFTMDNGGALGSSIQSIAITALSDPGTVNVLIDDVLACNRLSLTSLIGKESAEVAYEIYPIQSINGTTILLDYNGNNGISSTRGYYGTTETVAIYAREPIAITAAQAPNEAGSAGNINLYKAGYNTSDMTSQDGITILDGKLGTFNGLNIANSNANYSSFDRIFFVRCSFGYALQNNGNKSIRVTNANCIGGSSGGFSISGSILQNGIYLNNIYAIANAGAGIALLGGNIIGGNLYSFGNGSNNITISSCRNVHVQNVYTYNSAGSGVSDTGTACSATFLNITSKDHLTNGISMQNGGTINIRRLTTSGNSTAGCNAAGGSIINVDNTDCTDSTKITTDANSWTRVNVSNYEGSPGDYRVFGNITTLIAHETTIENTSGKGSSKHTPSTDFDTNLPLIQKFGMVVVNSGSQTHSIYIRRSSSSGTGRFVLRGGQIAGVDSDVTVSTSGATDTFLKYDLIFNPTESGVPIEFELQSFGTGSIYFADYVAP